MIDSVIIGDNMQILVLIQFLVLVSVWTSLLVAGIVWSVRGLYKLIQWMRGGDE